MSLETLQCRGESLDVHLPIEPWPSPCPHANTRSQSARFFPLIPFSSPSLCGKNLPLRWDLRICHAQRMVHDGSPFYASFPGLACCSRTWTLPQCEWTRLHLISVYWHYSLWVPPSRLAPPRPQSDWAAPGFWVSLPFSHWRPDLHLISASAITVSVTLSQLLISLQRRYFRVFVGRVV